MTRLTGILLYSMGISVLLSGCAEMNNTEQTPTSDEFSISVLEYNGEGYALPYGKETDQIAEEYREEIEAKTIKFFQENYQTEIVVHNVVGALNGATIFVESVGEPHFYTNAVVPVNVSEKQVMTDQIWAIEYPVQNAIQGGLYHMIFNQEFKQLDYYFTALPKEGQITGKNEEALKKMGGHGFMTPYYFYFH